MSRLLPSLRRRSGALALLGLLALLLAPAMPDREGRAEAFSLIICTTEGLVSVPVGEKDAPAPAEAHEHCATCLGRDLAFAPPPPPGPERRPGWSVAASHTPEPPAPHPSPHLRPRTRAPPALG
ncbi:DUF2946 family protein [Elioraea rosea]|uniref:DUF2946 family protein n=1 Tax=Elioraea rosea TaxID=2492390 RepID=UPI00131526EE|nr:DUF2946 family protein [Elioraea rosea]